VFKRGDILHLTLMVLPVWPGKEWGGRQNPNKKCQGFQAQWLVALGPPDPEKRGEGRFDNTKKKQPSVFKGGGSPKNITTRPSDLQDQQEGGEGAWLG